MLREIPPLHPHQRHAAFFQEDLVRPGPRQAGSPAGSKRWDGSGLCAAQRALGDDMEEGCYGPVGVGAACSFLAPEDQRELAVTGRGRVIVSLVSEDPYSVPGLDG